MLFFLKKFLCWENGVLQSAPEVMTSSEASSSEASCQKLNITRSCSSLGDARLKASKVV